MQISSINSINTARYQNCRYKVQKGSSNPVPVTSLAIQKDTFTKNPSFTAKPFTVEWYKTLTKDQINNINKKACKHIFHNEDWLGYDKTFNRYLQYHDIVASEIADVLNTKFGAENYIVIPVGRSLSSIGKCLGYKIGEDKIKPLPMSSAGRFVDLENCVEDFRPFIKYLESIGLTKEIIKTSGKHYIFMDYCCSGNSLKGVKSLFESDKRWGHQENVHFEDISNLLSDIKPDKFSDRITRDIFWHNFSEDLEYSRYKRYSLVKDCPRFSYLKEAVIKPEDYTYEQQVFYWKLLDNEMNR